MPLDVEGKPICRLLVRQTVHLLEDQTPQGGVQLFGRTAASFGKIGGNLMDGQLPEDMFLEDAGPRLGQKLLPFRSPIVPRIKKVERLVIARMNHLIHLQTIDILCDSYHFKEQMSRKILQYRKLF
jgi:hypothetical protein